MKNRFILCRLSSVEYNPSCQRYKTFIHFHPMDSTPSKYREVKGGEVSPRTIARYPDALLPQATRQGLDRSDLKRWRDSIFLASSPITSFGLHLLLRLWVFLSIDVLGSSHLRSTGYDFLCPQSPRWISLVLESIPFLRSISHPSGGST